MQVQYSQTSVVAKNKVLRNTYFLLSLTLIFSAITATFAMVTNAPALGILPTLILFFGLTFAVKATANSGWGILTVFLFTGFMGYMLGPILNLYIYRFANGAELIATAFFMTAFIFLSLSGYVLVTGKNFAFMGGILMTGIIVVFLASLANIFFKIPALSLALSAVMVILMSGMILYNTSEIVNGGETNYILATVSLYVTIFNLFVSLLQLLGVFGGRQ